MNYEFGIKTGAINMRRGRVSKSRLPGHKIEQGIRAANGRSYNDIRWRSWGRTVFARKMVANGYPLNGSM